MTKLLNNIEDSYNNTYNTIEIAKDLIEASIISGNTKILPRVLSLLELMTIKVDADLNEILEYKLEKTA